MSVCVHRHFVEDFVWDSEGSFDFTAIRDLEDVEASLPLLSGHFALHLEQRGRHLLVRDPLGVNKLFVTVHGQEVISSNYLVDLLRRGCRIEHVTSVPSGHALWLDPQNRTARFKRYRTLSFNDDSVETWDACQPWLESIQDALKTTFLKIQGIARNRPTYVTMSGGLDSTIIACMAQDHIPGVQGITLSIAGHTESEDVQYARRVAQDLRIPLRVITATPQDIVSLMDDVLVWGQDWRDFNVHCGLVNAALGRVFSATLAGKLDRRPLLLTGDTMNEMVADYEPVRYGDQEFYTLPRLDWGQRRRFLVAGLDSGDREVGILAKMGFSTIQPYAVAAPAYLRLPSGFLGRPHAKQDVARQMFGARIPQYVLERPKVRAQVASSAKPGGTLAVLMDAGLDDAFLKKRWCELFDIPRESLSGIIRGGVYRCSTNIYSYS